jgi:hypothetical protein
MTFLDQIAKSPMGVWPPNHSLERTQPQRDFKDDVAVLRRSARGR